MRVCTTGQSRLHRAALHEKKTGVHKFSLTYLTLCHWDLFIGRKWHNIYYNSHNVHIEVTVIVVWTGWTLCRAWDEFMCIILYFRIFVYLLMYNYNMAMWQGIQRRNPTWPTCSTRTMRNT